jgi:hypothetical protein
MVGVACISAANYKTQPEGEGAESSKDDRVDEPVKTASSGKSYANSKSSAVSSWSAIPDRPLGRR